MLKASDEALKKRIRRLVNRWGGRLNIPGDWTVSVEWEGPELGTSEVDTRYKTIQLTFNLDRVRNECDDFGLEELIVHELCHIYTWKIWMLAARLLDMHYTGVERVYWAEHMKDLHEEATTALGMAFTQIAHEGK